MLRPACLPGACARTCAHPQPLVLVAVLVVDRRHARQHALAQVMQARFLSQAVVISPVHLREQSVVSSEALAVEVILAL